MTTIKELLPISNNKIGEEEINAVSARDLHKFLGITERFQQWINKQLSFGFEENVDFVGCKIFNTLANLELQDYCLSLDCAKQLAMMQRNEKGTEARKYFIECEKKLQTHTLPQTKIEAVRAYLEELEAYEATRVGGQTSLAHKKEIAKLENGKSIYGASIRQVALKTGRNYSAKKLTRWCKANCRPPLVVRQDNLNGYSSAKVSVYHEEVWKEVYDIELLEYFEEDELQYPYEHH